jgi:hypothetical protein
MCCTGNIDDESWGSNFLPPSTAVAMPNAQPLAAAVLKPGVDGQAIVAAVLKPEYSDALARHNGYRQKHQVGKMICQCLPHVVKSIPSPIKPQTP